MPTFIKTSPNLLHVTHCDSFTILYIHFFPTFHPPQPHFCLSQKRVVQRKQRYFTQKISGTPFSLGIAMPDGYGKYKVHGQIELTRAIQDDRGSDGENTKLCIFSFIYIYIYIYIYMAYITLIRGYKRQGIFNSISSTLVWFLFTISAFSWEQLICFNFVLF